MITYVMADSSTFVYNMPPESADTITEITNQTNNEPASQDAPQSTASAAGEANTSEFMGSAK